MGVPVAAKTEKVHQNDIVYCNGRVHLPSSEPWDPSQSTARKQTNLLFHPMRMPSKNKDAWDVVNMSHTPDNTW